MPLLSFAGQDYSSASVCSRRTTDARFDFSHLQDLAQLSYWIYRISPIYPTAGLQHGIWFLFRFFRLCLQQMAYSYSISHSVVILYSRDYLKKWDLLRCVSHNVYRDWISYVYWIQAIIFAISPHLIQSYPILSYPVPGLYYLRCLLYREFLSLTVYKLLHLGICFLTFAVFGSSYIHIAYPILSYPITSHPIPFYAILTHIDSNKQQPHTAV